MQNPWDNLKGAPPVSSVTSKPLASLLLNNLPTANIAANASVQNAPALVENAAFSASSDSAPAKTDSNRKSAIVVLLIGVALTAFDWWLLKTQHEYYVKAAVLGPLCAVGGLMGLIWPQIFNDKNPAGRNKVLSFVTFALGLAAGALNWYLMAN